MFVGDSLNRNQWESMVCLVQAEAPWDKKSLVKNGSLNVFRLQVLAYVTYAHKLVDTGHYKIHWRLYHH